MSLRDIYEAVLVEMNKVNAPNILLEDFNYFCNKAINQYVNKRYNVYDTTQQTTDDLRVLKTTALLSPSVKTYSDGPKSLNATYRVELPSDYLHMLNCICVFKVNGPWRCYDNGDTFEYPATKLTADLWGQVVNNFWNKPTYRRPYYYIHNGITDGSSTPPESESIDNISGENWLRDGYKKGDKRYGNRSKVYCEIRYGTDKETFLLDKVYIDYIKVPKFVRLTQSQIDKVADTSDVLEFPDYVCQEIINELVHIIMENIKEERLQTHPVVSQSIAAQQLAPEQQ